MLKISLGAIPNLEVVDAVGDGNAAVEAAEKFNPDVVLMDIELGGEPNGIAAGRSIKKHKPEAGIVILSGHRKRQYVNLVTVDESAGWSYLLKQSVSDAAALARAIEGAASGLVVMGPHCGKQHEAPQKLGHRRADPAPARSAEHDGPRLQQRRHCRQVGAGHQVGGKLYQRHLPGIEPEPQRPHAPQSAGSPQLHPGLQLIALLRAS